MDKVTKDEIQALIANQIKDMELSGVFNEATLDQIQEKVSSRIDEESDNIVLEEAIPEEEVEVVPSEDPVPAETTSVNPEAPVVTDNEYEVELPDFLDKIEPAKFVIFDMNEVSLGGEQLSNKPFRLYADPDVKKSIHDAWKEEGKKTAEVYVAKFEKVGTVDFDYRNGTSYFTEKRIEQPEETGGPVYQENPYATEATPQEVENKPVEMAVQTAVDVEDQVKQYIEDVLRKHFSNPSDETAIVKAPIDAYDEVEDEEPLGGPDHSYPVTVAESDLKYKDIVMNEKEYVKIDTPDELRESIENGSGKATLLSKSDNVQTWVFEGQEYYLPLEVISAKKCHTKNKETL